MNEVQAKAILKDYIKPTNVLYDGPKYVNYPVGRFDEDGNAIPGDDVTLDATFTLEELEAIVWWMQNKPVSESK